MNSERYALRTALAEVMVMYEKRTELVDNASAVLKAANLADPHELHEWEEAKQDVRSADPGLAVTPDNEQLRAIDARLLRAGQAGDRLMASARAGLNVEKAALADLQRLALKAATDADTELVSKIETARMKYSIQVKSYNQIMKIFPVNIAAMVMGEEQRVPLQTRVSADAEGKPEQEVKAR